MFYGAKAGDVQPDWLDTSKIAIPQADEQQRLLVNLITLMERDKMPLPRFWYLPRGEKAVVVMSGDDHRRQRPAAPPATSTASRRSARPAASVAELGVRALNVLHLSRTAPSPTPRPPAYVADGFEIALHPVVGPARRRRSRRRSSPRVFDTQLSASRASTRACRHRSRAGRTASTGPTGRSKRRSSSRTACGWTPTTTTIPAGWIGAKPGFLNGGGFPMRFADVDGTPIDVYQAEHQHDRRDRRQAYPATVDALLDNASAPQGYYGAFGVEHAHRQPRASRRRRGDRRLRAGARRAR